MPEYTYKIEVNNFSYSFKYRAFLYADRREVDCEFCFTLWGAKYWVKRAKKRHENRYPRTVEEGEFSE